jgi:hypothetical protein
MSQLKSTLGRTLQSQNQAEIYIEGPSYDEYDLLVVSRNRMDSEQDMDFTQDADEVVHKTMMIKRKYLEWARKLVGDKLTRKNAGLGSILSTLVREYSKERQRKLRLLNKMRDCFDLIVKDTDLLVSNRKHGRLNQYEHYQKRANKGRQIFKRMYYEYAFDTDDLKEIFEKDEIRQIKTWIISSEDNFSQAVHSWSETFKKTSNKKIWNQ